MTRKNCHAFLQLDKGANGSIVAVGALNVGEIVSLYSLEKERYEMDFFAFLVYIT